MTFACLYIPNFAVQTILRAQPELCSSPLAMVDETGFVVATNEAALEVGIEPGSRVLEARMAAVETRPRSRAQEEAAHAALLDLGFSFSPRLEDRATDTIILDLAGLENLLGSLDETARRMQRRAAELGFQAHIAVAANPETALHAARGFQEITMIPPGDEREHLGSLPLEVLEPPAEMLATLHRWGVRTFKALASLPAAPLSERLGQEGVRLQALARGVSSRPLIPTQAKLRFEEVMELDDPVDQLDSLAFVLGLLLNRLCARLEARALATQEMVVELELDARQVDDPAARNLVTSGYAKRLRLPVPSRNPRALLKLLQLHLNAHPPAASVVKVKIRAKAAKPRAMQGGLFLPVSPDPEKLEVTLVRLAKMVGEENVGSPELLDTHRPAAFRMTRFDLFDQGGRARAGPQAPRAPRDKLAVLRIFRPPRPARVETREGFPVRVSFASAHGEAVSVAGPWRTSGEWWAESGWQRDEWDVELNVRRRTEGHGLESGRARTLLERALYRIYRDLASGDWFVAACYD